MKIAEVVGRTDDLRKIRGVLFTPVSVEELLRGEFKEIGEFEILLKREGVMDEIALRYETLEALGEDAGLDLQKRLGQRLKVKTNYLVMSLAYIPLKIGDTVGIVLSIDLLSVKVRKFDNQFIRIPNETLVKSEVVNVTRYPIRRVNVMVGVAYREDLDRVAEFLDRRSGAAEAEALRADPGVGLIQSFPGLIGAETLFGRVQQFSNAAYSWLVAEGLAKAREEGFMATDEAGLLERLDPYKVPKDVVVVEALPRSAAGKVDLAALDRLGPIRAKVTAAAFSLPKDMSRRNFLQTVVVFTLACGVVGALVLWRFFAAAGVDQNFRDQLTLGVVVGVDMPSTRAPTAVDFAS